MKIITTLTITFLSVLLNPSSSYADKTPAFTTFSEVARQKGVELRILRGVCRYESDSGRVKVHQNKNGSWDVGYCQNHRNKSEKQPRIPGDKDSILEAAKELKYWRRQHERFCVKHYEVTGKCGVVKYGKWRGIKNCHKPHYWWAHYNHGFRVLSNKYSVKVDCFTKNGFKKCDQETIEATKINK